jgi:hypothetical protein
MACCTSVRRDEIIDMRSRLMRNDAAMMDLIANDRQPAQRRTDLEAVFRADTRRHAWSAYTPPSRALARPAGVEA